MKKRNLISTLLKLTGISWFIFVSGAFFGLFAPPMGVYVVVVIGGVLAWVAAPVVMMKVEND